MTRSNKGDSGSCPESLTNFNDGDPQRSTARTGNGRFASPYSGNPKGRPPKPKEDTGAILRRLLNEAAPGSSGSSGIVPSIGELLARKAIVDAMADPRLALSLLKLVMGSSSPVAPSAETKDDNVVQQKAILDGYVTREMRKRQLADAESTKENDNPGDDEDEQ